MRWPDIFFKSRRPKLPMAPSRETPSKSISKLPNISKLEKSVEPSPVKTAADKTTAESLQALKQSDTIRIIPAGSKEAPAPAKTTEITTPKVGAASEAESLTGGTSSFRRRAKMTDVARILPCDEESISKSLDEEPPTAKSVPEPEIPAVVPAAFSVEVPTGSVMEKKEGEAVESAVKPEKNPNSDLSDTETFDKKGSSFHSESAPGPFQGNEVPDSGESRSLKDTTRVVIPESESVPPKSFSNGDEIEPTRTDGREKREFVLANGERILGHILSETAEAIYLDHPTLGVLTLPRTQIAKKPIEVILINGDRIVGDLIAETTECLYIRHASLGMLTVPHNQRSTRVVEAILKDGDRILGEVLAETDLFTVIRSATLGTVAVQHAQVAMLNRKIEQMQLRALPPSSPALDDVKRD